jgi:hypothetical protein
MNDKVADLIVDGEQRSDIKQAVHLSPGDSIFKESSFQKFHGDSTLKKSSFALVHRLVSSVFISESTAPAFRDGLIIKKVCSYEQVSYSRFSESNS